MSHQTVPTTEQQNLSNLWHEHMRTEFDVHRPNEAIKTMVANLFVNQVPVMIGGNTVTLGGPRFY